MNEKLYKINSDFLGLFDIQRDKAIIKIHWFMKITEIFIFMCLHRFQLLQVWVHLPKYFPPRNECAEEAVCLPPPRGCKDRQVSPLADLDHTGFHYLQRFVKHKLTYLIRNNQQLCYGHSIGIPFCESQRQAKNNGYSNPDFKLYKSTINLQCLRSCGDNTTNKTEAALSFQPYAGKISAFGLIPTMMLPCIQFVIINLNCHMLWAQGLEGLPNNPF